MRLKVSLKCAALPNITLIALSLLLLQFNVISAVAEPEREKVDANIPMVAALNVCKTSTQLDCIENVVINSADGRRLPAIQISSAVEFEVDEDKQRVESGASTWEYKKSSGAMSTFILDATLTTPTYVASGSIDEVEVVSSSQADSEEESDESTESVKIDTRFFDPKLSINAIFSNGDQFFPSKKLLAAESLEIVVRTSWLQIEEVYLPGKTSMIKVDSISGGKKITVTGSEVIQYQRQSSQNKLTGVITSQTIEKEDFEFLILHPRKDQESCQEKGFKATSTNATSLSLSDESGPNFILFNASGYGFRVDGTVNPGFAIIRMPLSWIACKFPNSDLPLADTFNVNVKSTDGSRNAQNPITKAVLQGTLLEVTVENFTFARTEIVIEASAEHILAKKKQASEAKAKAEAEAKAKAEAEAKAKAEAEAKAKAEAEAKAKAEAEAKAKAEAEAKAKAEAEAKAKAEAEAKARAAKSKKTTIICVKGKNSKKVTGVQPKCPSGYKKK
jgi:hypothetical protein